MSTKKDKAFIYALFDPTTNEIRYVGKTFNPKERLQCHCCDREDTHKARWIRGLRTIGVKPVMEILEEVVFTLDQEWESVEQFWISYLRFIGCKLTNSDSGGGEGRRLSPETRARISAGGKGKNIGHPVSAATRKAVAAAQSTRVHSFTERLNRSLNLQKMCNTKAGRERMSKAALARWHPAEPKSDDQNGMYQQPVTPTDAKKALSRN